MAKEHEFESYGHPSVYSNKDRKYKIYFSVPDNGTNEKTGILLFIAGFGGNANSNVYKKMRNTFSDKYNLITIQCDYFGYEFMQGASNLILDIDKIQNFEQTKNIGITKTIIFEDIIRAAKLHNFRIPLKEKLNESTDNYNEMGLIQAIDNVSAVISLIEIINDNKSKFDSNRILIYGDSHGAYLGYLCNAVAPTLFSLIIDNSAWLLPQYLKSNRYLFQVVDEALVTIEFEYLAKNLSYDNEILDISLLYKKFTNRCTIVCYHGTNDNLINHIDKRKLKNIIANFHYYEIDEELVDAKIFKNNSHGLGADFIELFDFTFNRFYNIEKGYDINNESIIYKTTKSKYLIDYTDKIPKLKIR